MIPHISCFSDPEDYRITDGTTVWHFDWSEQFGPSLTNGKGEIRANPYPSGRSPFWRYFGLWLNQGKRWEPSGTKGVRLALWDEPPTGRYMVDQRGVTIETDEPEGFDEQWSPVEYVDEAGNPYQPRKRRRTI